MLVYVHVPFCASKCRYCGFCSWQPRPGEMELYGRALLQEIEHWRRRLGRRKMETLFIGGGTPSLLPAPALGALFKALDRAFGIPRDIEITMEANPESAAASGYLKEVRSLGVNRLSLGVQSLSDEMLKALGRAHSSKQALKAVNAARSAGFTNLSLDFIWGLPGQRLSQWLGDLKQAVQLRPEHLSCYGLTLEPGAPLTESVERGEVALPEETEQSKMFVYGAEFLEGHGYMQYEISNFGQMGYLSVHNQGYWAGKDYLGLGPSAVSTIHGRRWANPEDLEEYARRALAGNLDAEAEVIDREIRARERLMLSLRTSKGLGLRDFKALSGVDLVKENPRLIQARIQKDLVRIRDGRLRLTRTGMVVSNTILERLFEALEEAQARQTEA